MVDKLTHVCYYKRITELSNIGWNEKILSCYYYPGIRFVYAKKKTTAANAVDLMLS